MAVSKVEIQDDAGNVYHPHTEAAVVFLKDGSTVEQNVVLNAACTYASSAYTLSIPNAPAAYPAFFSVRFKAPNDYVDGAKIKIGSSAYTPKNAAFASGDVVTADFDKAALKCFFKSGGGGGVIGSMGVDIIVAASRPAAVTNNRIVVINGAQPPKIIVTTDIPAYSSSLAQNTIFIRTGAQVADRPTINAGSKAGNCT